MEEREISNAVISRLPRYFRYLRDLKKSGVQRISSQELSDIMKVTASQIRQDLNNFGGFGQQGYGYNVEHLYDEIGKILGVGAASPMILVGAGNLGQALVNYSGFTIMGFDFAAAFDQDRELHGTSIGSAVIRPMEEIESFVRDNDIEIAVLTVPREAAQPLSERLVRAGISAIWNFAHVDLELPEGVIVENVHLSDSLLRLSYNLSNRTGIRR